MSYTVGELLDFIEKNKIPRDAKVFLQRIEDSYFEGSDISGMMGQLADGTYRKLPEGSKASGWAVVKKEGYNYFLCKNFNNKILSGEFDDKEDYPNFTDEMKKLIPDEELEKAKDQYFNCQSPVKYSEDNNLYLDGHY